MLNNIKGKIIKSAKAPDTGDQQSDVSQTWLLGDQNTCSHQASHKEQESFHDDDATTFQVSERHGRILKKHSPKANQTTQHESIGDLTIITLGQIAVLSLLDKYQSGNSDQTANEGFRETTELCLQVV